MVLRHGEFTVLVILTEISKRSVTPLSSTYLHVIGNEIAWDEIKALFKGPARNWDGAAFFPTKARDASAIDNSRARQRLVELQAKVR